MESILNILHYCLYCIHYRIHVFLNKINPFWLLAKIPFIKRRHEKFGIDIHKIVDRGFADKRFGLSTIVAGGELVGILFLFTMGISHLVIKLFHLRVVFDIPHFTGFVLIPYLYSYVYVFKKDKYLTYFRKFEKWTRYEKRKNVNLTLGFVIVALGVFFGSMMV